jgi:putative hydrolase of the HAD superfamily
MKQDSFVIDHWLFDLDYTLYPADAKIFDRVHQKMAAFMEERLGIDATAAAALREDYFLRYGTTAMGLAHHHGINAGEFSCAVHDVSIADVKSVPGLDAAITALPGQKYVFTNATKDYAEKLLHHLGLWPCFAGLFAAEDSNYIAKPNPEPYALIEQKFLLPPMRTLMIDDTARNLPPAKKQGWRTLWFRHRQREPFLPDIDDVTDDLVSWLRAQVSA